MTHHGELYTIGFAGWVAARVGDTLSATPDGGDLDDTRTIAVEELAAWCAGHRRAGLGAGGGVVPGGVT